MEGIGG